jgi:hypothetical protein
LSIRPYIATCNLGHINSCSRASLADKKNDKIPQKRQSSLGNLQGTSEFFGFFLSAKACSCSYLYAAGLRRFALWAGGVDAASLGLRGFYSEASNDAANGQKLRRGVCGGRFAQRLRRAVRRRREVVSADLLIS